MFYKEDCIVHEPKDHTDAVIPPNKPVTYPFMIPLDPALPASIAYEEGGISAAAKAWHADGALQHSLPFATRS